MANCFKQLNSDDYTIFIYFFRIILRNRISSIVSLPVSTVTSKSLATRCLPLTRNRLPRSALVNRPTFTSILWHNTSISNSFDTSRMSSMNSSPSSNRSKWCLHSPLLRVTLHRNRNHYDKSQHEFRAFPYMVSSY